MRLDRADLLRPKGWFFGPWNPTLNMSLGYANKGIDEPHFHQRMTEIYMVARGLAAIRVEQETIELSEGDVLVVEPGEAHTFLSSSSDYFHFVMHLPALEGEEATADKVPVPDSRFGL
ncbi:MAG: cupin domain-containing protein [Chloroflexia bacterium]